MQRVANRNARHCHGDRKGSLDDGQITNVRGARVALGYGLQPCRVESAGVAKRPRERSRHPKSPIVTIRDFFSIAVPHLEAPRSRRSGGAEPGERVRCGAAGGAAAAAEPRGEAEPQNPNNSALPRYA